YERTTTVDGRIVSEKWNKTDGSGEYGTTLAERFMVKAEGQVDSIDTLKSAVEGIDADTLAALAK
ncbi:MAG: YIP1 family protein, partial [Sphingobium sp.]